MTRIVSILIIAVFFTGCHTAKVNVRDNDHASAWLNRFNPDGPGYSFFYGEQIPVVVIPDIYKAEYITRLENNQYVELTAEEYTVLTRYSLRMRYGLAVRGVYTQIYGHFFATQSEDGSILVTFTYSGAGYDQLNKTVLLLETDRLPKEIYVTFIGAPYN